MADDLPIYSDSMLRTRLQFADLERLKGLDTAPAWEKADTYIEQLEGAVNARAARESVEGLTKSGLLQMHAILFSGRDGAGALRRMPQQPLYRGQDCPDPEFIGRSLDNFLNWLTAESVSEIHPIERAALVLTRVVDIWPFDSGNLTLAIAASNLSLRNSGLAPFFVLPQHRKEFEATLAHAMTIETQPLVNAIYNTVKREMEALVSR